MNFKVKGRDSYTGEILIEHKPCKTAKWVRLEWDSIICWGCGFRGNLDGVKKQILKAALKEQLRN